MLKKYLLVLFLLSLNHVVIYGASADKDQLITNQKALTDEEKTALLEFLNKRELLTFKGPKGDILGLVPGQVTLEDQTSTLSEYIKISLEQNSPVISIFNDNGTYYSGAAIANGVLPEAKKEDKYILNLRELLSPSGQSSAVATGSTQAGAVTNQGPQLLKLLRDADQASTAPVGPLQYQPQPTVFATTLRPQGPPTVYGHGLSPMQQPSLGRTGQQAGIPLTLIPHLLPFHFQQQLTALQIEAARMAEQERQIQAAEIAERERQIQAAEIAERERQIQAARIAAQERQIAELAERVDQLMKMQMQGPGKAEQQATSLSEQESSTGFEIQGPSVLESPGIAASAEQAPISQAPISTEGAQHKPVKQAMPPDELKRLILKGVSDANLRLMGVTDFDIAQAQQELAQETSRQLTIDQNKQKQEPISLQEEQDRALALELQEQEQELARKQQVQNTRQQPAERDKKSADDQLENQQTESVKHSNAARPTKKEMQRAERARKKAELEAKVKEWLISLSDEDYQKFITQSEQNSSHRRPADNADEIKNAALKIYREQSYNNRQFIRAIKLARIEKAEKEEAEREKIEKAQKKAQEEQAEKEASAKTAKQKLEEAQLARQLAQESAQKQAKSQQQGSSRNRKQKGKGSGNLSADSAALQAEKEEKDQRERAFLAEEAARNAQAKELSKEQKKQTIIEKELGKKLYQLITQKDTITAQSLKDLSQAQKNENNKFETRMAAAKAIIEGPYSSVFDKVGFIKNKQKAIDDAIVMVAAGGYYEGIEAAIKYYLNQSSLTEDDKKRLEYLMRNAEECFLEDNREETAKKRDAEIEELKAKIDEKLKPKDSTFILQSLKGQQQPKPNAQMVVDQFNEGLKRWGRDVLIDPVEGRKILNEDYSKRNKLIEELNWWTVSLGAIIGTHAQSTELQKILDLMNIIDIYARLFNAVILSTEDKDETLNEKAKKQLEKIRKFLLRNLVELDQGHGQLQETDTTSKAAEIQGKLMIIRTLIEQSDQLLKARPDFFRNLLENFQEGLVVTQNVIYDESNVQFTSQEIELYTQELNDWIEPLNYLFDIPRDKLKQEDLDAQFSQFCACIKLLSKMINAARTIRALEKLLKLTKGYIRLLDKAQHLKGQRDFDKVDKYVRSFESVIEENLNLLRKPKKN